LRGEADTVVLPGYQLLLAAPGIPAHGCARISVFDVAPRTQQIYPAVIIAIDGRNPGPAEHTYRVEPGPRRITVAEAIDPHRFNALQHLARSRFSPPASASGEPYMQSQRSDRYKDLLIDVRPGMTYRIGAQFHPERAAEVRNNAHWDPVVWREFAQPCR
jgi:hypothetical protein